ncbi:beta-L-arabinofuranosidase domain-containing protein [Kitasatospora paranensis]|uniref:Beta-L-arabinofuranosidase domain-containing protein n=1 Tax=Kitasatospora paranensis TaxID=258053 RepID=A0ABW2FR78_9ACTN
MTGTSGGIDRRNLLRLTVAGAVAAGLAPGTATAATAPVGDARADIGVQLTPFPADAVRLTAGRFLDSQNRRLAYMRFLDMDRLLYNFRTTARLSTQGAEPCGGWESPTWGWRGHMVGHYLSGASLAVAATGDSQLRANVTRLVAELAKCQAAATAAGYRTGYLGGFPEGDFTRMENGEYIVVWYTTHKIMAGLLDAHRLLGIDQALTVLLGFADWADWWTSQRSYTRMQADLDIEFGGMNGVLADLYQLTGDSRWLTVAQRFDHARVFDPLAAGQDQLDGFHANTQMAKVMGAVREYEATGTTRYRDIARNYWDIVVQHHTYCTGGNSDGEIYHGPDQISNRLSSASCEVCNVYNLLKITRELFFLDPGRADYMDYYEWALYNEILPQQDPTSAHGRVTYYLDLRPGAAKVYDDDYGTFWCDTGSSLETYAKLNDSIYFSNGRTLWVNLFIPSVLTWSATGLTVTQTTNYPAAATSTLTIGGSGAAVIRVRIPKWATGASLTVNGAAQPATPGTYATLDRTWAGGDTVTVTLPMALRLTAAPDDPAVQSVSYGPVLLAGQYGAFSQGPNPGSPPAPSPQVLQHLPELDPASLAPTGTALTFTARADGAAVTLRPYFDTHNQYGTVYWTNPTRSAYVRLRNRGSGLVLGITGMSTADGAAALQWADTGTADHQWELAPSAGYVRLRNRNSGKVLGVTGMSTADGAAVVQWTDNGTTDHDWQLVDAGGGRVKLVNRNSGKLLGVAGGATTQGAALVQSGDTGTDDHVWEILPDGWVRLQNVGSGLLLGVQNAGRGDGAAALQWHDSGTADHGWTFVPDTDGAFRIRNQNSGKVLGVTGMSTADGAAVLQWTDNGTRDHLWRMLVTGNGDRFRLLNVNSGLVLGVQNGATGAGATCVQSVDNGAADRLWRLR